MFYKQTQPDELTRAQMEAARKAYRGKLLRLRYSPQFILNNADELLAIAHSEYARAVKNGVEVEDPIAWTIHCAWRRTQNLLQAESIRPRNVSSELVAEVVDDGGVLPEEQALEEDRARKVREAVGKLDPDQQKVIALTFFEDMSVREAARHLGCSASSVQHRRETALRTLRRFLPVRSGDELAVDVGMACWLALAAEHSSFHLPAGFEAVIDRAGQGASGLWTRLHDLARRFSAGGGEDAATAVASSGAGRAAGACATGLAVICLAGAGSGLVGPGIGGIGGHGHPAPPASDRHPSRETRTPAHHRPSTRTVPLPAARDPASTEPTAEPVPAPTSSKSPTLAQARRVEQTKTPATAEASAHHEEVAQVEAETSGIARAGAESPTTSSPVASASEEASSAPTTVVHTGKTSPSPTSKATAAEEFGFEK